jgi:NADH dehydrogenase
MAIERVAVFGGTGFLGRRIVCALGDAGMTPRIVSRSPHARADVDAPYEIEAVAADIRQPDQVAAALRGCDAAVNAVSLYRETAQISFEEIHVSGAETLARTCGEAGLRRLVQISGIGSDPASESRYIRCRGVGEMRVRSAFAGSVVVRPSVMFGADDAFLTALADLLRRVPIMPLFGRGETRLQPVCVEDVAEGIRRILTAREAPSQIYEFAGPKPYSYAVLLRLVMDLTGYRRPTIPLPFAVWNLIAAAGALLPAPPVTRGQVDLMRRDNVPSGELPGLADLGVTPTDLATAAGACLR